MPFNFPTSNLAVGQTSTQNGRSYTYAGGSVWELTPSSGGGALSGSVTIPASDPYWDSVLLLLRGDGNFADASKYGRTLTAHGNAAANAAGKYGTHSIALDGTGDYLSTSSSDFNFGTGDFTLEAWVWMSAVGSYAGVFSNLLSDGNLGAGISFGVGPAGKPFVLSYSFGPSVYQESASALPTAQWVHLAVVRSAGTVTVYQDGNSIITATVAWTISDTSVVVGRVYRELDTNYWNGRIAELRVTKAARFTANFTPPTAALPTTVLSASPTTLPVTITGSGGGGSGLSWSSVPASATAAGTAGSIAYDHANGFFYVATATDSWKRAALSTWTNFTPSSVSGLAAWLDASDASTLYDATSGGSSVAADGAVARWADKSGAGNHAIQATSGSRPTRRLSGLNSKASVEFVADTADSGDWLGIAHASALNGASGLAIFCVYKTATTGSNRGLLGKWPGVDQTTGPAWIVAYTGSATSATTATMYAHDGANAATQATTSNFNDGAARLLGYVNTSAGLQARMNGSLQGTNASTLFNSASTAGVVIGGYTAYGLESGQRLMSCHISELLIYNASLTAQNVTDIESYLMTKWGVV